jgi:hypothetical protein
MESLNCFGTQLHTGSETPQKPDNDNWGVEDDTMTLAEAMQLILRWKTQAWKELAKNPLLWACPKHRKDRHVTYEMEKCARWQRDHKG